MKFKYVEYIKAFSAFDESYTDKATPTLFDAKQIYENTNKYLDKIANTSSTDSELNKIVQTIRQLNTFCCSILCIGLKGQFSFDQDITPEVAMVKISCSTLFAQDALKKPFSFLDTIIAYDKKVVQMKLNSQSLNQLDHLSDGDRLLLSNSSMDTPLAGQRFGSTVDSPKTWIGPDSMNRRSNLSLFFSGGLSHLTDKSTALDEEVKIVEVLNKFRFNVLLTQNLFGIEVPSNFRQEMNPFDNFDSDDDFDSVGTMTY